MGQRVTKKGVQFVANVRYGVMLLSEVQLRWLGRRGPRAVDCSAKLGRTIVPARAAIKGDIVEIKFEDRMPVKPGNPLKLAVSPRSRT